MDIPSLLSDLLFTLGPKSKVKFKLELFDEHLKISTDSESEKKARIIKYADIIGLKLNESMNSQNGGTPHSAPITQHLVIYSYPRTKSFLSSKLTRKRLCTDLGLNCLDTSENNLKVHKLLHEFILKKVQTHSSNQGGQFVRFGKPLLVLLNPRSGKGEAKKLFQNKIRPMFEEASVEFVCLETERAGHGEEIALSTDLSLYSGIVIVSGDGLLFEVYQGLMARPDSAQAVLTPVGILPAGSGNALCCSICYAAGEPFLHDMLTHSTFVLLKHHIRPMDLIALDTVAGRKYSFLSLTWGLIADIDIESERFRALGNARFTVEAIFRILSPRAYKGKLSFLPNSPYTHKSRSQTVTLLSHREREQPTTNGKVRSASTPNLSPRTSELGTAANTLRNGHADEAVRDIQEVEETGSEGDAEEEIELPPLDQPVPEHWVTIDDYFVSIVAVYQSHIGPEILAAPAATMTDKLIHLLIIRSPVTRLQMLNIMTQLETGSHTNNPQVELVAVKAFRLEPLELRGNMVVDGEKVAYGPIQGKVLPSAARVMAL